MTNEEERNNTRTALIIFFSIFACILILLFLIGLFMKKKKQTCCDSSYNPPGEPPHTHPVPPHEHPVPPHTHPVPPSVPETLSETLIAGNTTGNNPIILSPGSIIQTSSTDLILKAENSADSNERNIQVIPKTGDTNGGVFVIGDKNNSTGIKFDGPSVTYQGIRPASFPNNRTCGRGKMKGISGGSVIFDKKYGSRNLVVQITTYNTNVPSLEIKDLTPERLTLYNNYNSDVDFSYFITEL